MKTSYKISRLVFLQSYKLQSHPRKIFLLSDRDPFFALFQPQQTLFNLQTSPHGTSVFHPLALPYYERPHFSVSSSPLAEFILAWGSTEKRMKENKKNILLTCIRTTPTHAHIARFISDQIHSLIVLSGLV